MIGVVAVLTGAVLGYGLYELNWWITRRQFPELFEETTKR
jgi:hypothetical protein